MLVSLNNLNAFVPKFIELMAEEKIQLVQLLELDDSFLIMFVDYEYDEPRTKVGYIGKFVNEESCYPDEWEFDFSEVEWNAQRMDDDVLISDEAFSVFCSQLAGYGM